MVLTESQKQRDEELARLLDLPLDVIEAAPIRAPDSIRVFGGGKVPQTADEMEALYREFNHLNWVGYLRTLMCTSIKNRKPDLLELLNTTRNATCLDFGSGVGTHAIALAEQGNVIAILDVPGKLFDFAHKRLGCRDLIFHAYEHTDPLPDETFDLVICAHVLEHVFDPCRELRRIHDTMTPGGTLYLEVPKVIHAGHGHFKSSIVKWEQEGLPYLAEHFIKESDTRFVRK